MKFSETQIGFEIPKILATSDVALRLLHTRYDHVTPLFPTAIPEEERAPIVEEEFRKEKSTEKALSAEKDLSIEKASSAEKASSTEKEATSQDEEPELKQDREFNLVPEEETISEALEDNEVQRVGHCLSVCLSV